MNLTLAAPEVAGRDRGFCGADRRGAVDAALRTYRSATHGFAGMTNLDGVQRIMAEPPFVVPAEQLYSDQVNREDSEQGIGAYLRAFARFDRAVTRFAELNADRTEQDHAALLAAVADGRVTAAEQV